MKNDRKTYRKDWPIMLFREKHPSELAIGEMVFQKCYAYPESAAGPYRVKGFGNRQIQVEIVGMENSGTFNKAYSTVLVPRYR